MLLLDSMYLSTYLEMSQKYKFDISPLSTQSYNV